MLLFLEYIQRRFRKVSLVVVQEGRLYSGEDSYIRLDNSGCVFWCFFSLYENDSGGYFYMVSVERISLILGLLPFAVLTVQWKSLESLL